MNCTDRNDPNSYYYFDDKNKEIIIKRYDTPTPWMNYFSNGIFHTMMSQAGGAVSFYKSPQIWRINRYRFFHLPTDRSGLYYYIQDGKTGEYWCPTAEPAFLKPEKWTSIHGLGYTRFEATHNGIKADLLYFVGKSENCVIWNLELTNTSDEIREINLFSFVEFGMMEYLREQSWLCYNKHQLTVDFDSNINSIIYDYSVEMQPKPKETPLVYLASDKKLVAFDCDRDEFIGTYRSESNPYAIENDGCTNSTLKGGDPCGALQFKLILEPGKTETINTFLGTGNTLMDIEKSLEHCRQTDFVEKSYQLLQKEWNNYLSHFQCIIPDKDAERAINIWNPYQSQRNFLFSRNISFYATGTFRGIGFRDTSQDVLSQTPFDNKSAKEKVFELLTQQYADGHTNHYFFKTEGWAPLNRLHSDNHIWPILAVWNIVMEDGDISYLGETVPFYDGGEATVYQHLCKSIDFTQQNIGANGFPLMLTSDWNDMLYKVCREGKGESIWMSMFLGFALPKIAELAMLLNKPEDADKFMKFWDEQKCLVNTKAWDGKWFRRAIMDNGLYLGSNQSEEAKIFLNTQTWSVLSGMADLEKQKEAMNSVNEFLDTKLGIKKIWPPIEHFPSPEDPLSHYNKGCGENGAIFCHANTWAIIAECMLGNGDRALKYYHQLIPKVAMTEAGTWRYKAEPFVYASNFFGPESDKFGLANVSWLTGTASWMYVAITQYILGIRPVWNGLLVDPCLPGEWESVEIIRVFRKCSYTIKIKKSKGICKGVRHITVDGNTIDSNIIPFYNDRKKLNVEVFML